MASQFPLFPLAFCHHLIHLYQFQTVNLGEKGLEASQPEGLELSAHLGGWGGMQRYWWGPRCSQRGPQNKEGPCGNCRGLTEVTLPGGLEEAMGSARALSPQRKDVVPTGARAPCTQQALGPEGVVLSPGASAALPVHQKCLIPRQTSHSFPSGNH